MVQKVIVTMPRPLDSRFKSWAKTLTGVNQDAANGYAFEGEFVPLSTHKQSVLREFPIGTLILYYSESGSRKNNYPTVYLYRVDTDGLRKIFEHNCGTKVGWALEVRERIAEILAKEREQEEDESARRDALVREREQLLARLAQIESELQACAHENNSPRQ